MPTAVVSSLGYFTGYMQRVVSFSEFNMFKKIPADYNSFFRPAVQMATKILVLMKHNLTSEALVKV